MDESDVAYFREHHRIRPSSTSCGTTPRKARAGSARVETAHAELAAALDALEAALGESDWLSGERVRAGRHLWVVNAHRLSQAQFALDRWPRFAAWYEKAAARPAFERAVAAYQP